MEKEHKAILRVKSIFDSKIEFDYKRSNVVKLLLIEALRRSILWRKVLGEKARNNTYSYILDDVAGSINNDWRYSSKLDTNFKNIRINSIDRKVFDYYINWEIHSVEIFDKFHLPNPYEPLILLIEIGSGLLLDQKNIIRLRPVFNYFSDSLVSEINLKEQQVVLDYEWLINYPES